MAATLWSIHEAKGVAERDKDSEVTGYIVGALCWLLSAGVYVAAKWGVAEVPPWTFSFWRIAIAALILLPFVRRHFPEMWALTVARWPMLLLVGGLGLTVAQGCIYLALAHSSLIDVGLIMALMPLTTMVLAWIIVGEAMSGGQVLGTLVAGAGTAYIVLHGDIGDVSVVHFSVGEALAFGACLAFSLYTALLKREKFDLPRLPLLVVLLVAAVIVTIPLYAYELLRGEYAQLSSRGVLSVAYAAIPGGAAMYLLYNWSIDALGASRAGLMMYLQTVFVALLAYFLLGEAIEPYHFVGAGLIVAGVAIVIAFRRKPPAPAAQLVAQKQPGSETL